MNKNFSHKPHYDYIDCIRGYAVLMVMTSHYTYLFPKLPYPVHRIAVMGWYGVQLFFIASCLTLLMSWHFEEETRGQADRLSFFVRRFFRIAPAYYIAGILYFFIIPPKDGFNFTQALTTISFVNAWHPLLTPTVKDRWIVVPGGWSIGVEFTFYMLFPLFARSIRSLTAGICVLIVTVFIGTEINLWALGVFSGAYSYTAVQNFLFFWFPNQASVFVFGAIVYFLLKFPRLNGFSLLQTTIMAIAAVAGFFSLAFVHLGKFLGAEPTIPASLAVCLPLSVFVLALSQRNCGLFVNRYAAQIGRVSFSAYLFHFAVLRAIGATIPSKWLHASGLRAIAVFLMIWPIAASLSFAAAWCSYHLVERPGMATGKMLIQRLKHRRTRT